jgi:hypothetical protein
MHSCIFRDPFDVHAQRSVARLQGGEEEAGHRLQCSHAYRGQRGRSPLGRRFFLADGEIMADAIQMARGIVGIDDLIKGFGQFSDTIWFSVGKL